MLRTLPTVAFALGLPSLAWAGEVYRWVDAAGVVHFSDTKTDPAQEPYQEKAERTRPYHAPRADEDDGFGGESPHTLIIASAPVPPPPALDAIAPTAFDELLRGAAEHYHLPFGFLRAVAKVESNFNPRAVSSAKAKGLMQLIDATASDLRVKNPFDPRQNVYAAARYLRILANQFDGDLALTAAAYNAGPERVTKAGGVPPIPETTDYVRRVLSLYRQYERSKAE
jgi:soluble lytic murein transglycosylase-like protein